MATIFVAYYPKTLMETVYNEACLLLHAEDRKGPALFNSWIGMDDDEMIICGRENLGCPKNMVEIALVEDGEKVTGPVIRKGIEVLRLETTLGESVENPRSFVSQGTESFPGDIRSLFGVTIRIFSGGLSHQDSQYGTQGTSGETPPVRSPPSQSMAMVCECQGDAWRHFRILSHFSRWYSIAFVAPECHNNQRV